MSPIDHAVAHQSQTSSVETPSISYLIQVGFLVSAYGVSARLGCVLAFWQPQAIPLCSRRNWVRDRALGFARSTRDHPADISSPYSNHSRAKIRDSGVHRRGVLARYSLAAFSRRGQDST